MTRQTAAVIAALTVGLLASRTSAQAVATPAGPSPTPLMASIFQDHAVIQRDRPAPVWGRAAPGEAVTVTLGQASVQAVADAQGHWRADLPPVGAGGPYVLTATAASGARQSVGDILVGDVFLCSGQSNMEFGVRQGLNADTEVNNSTDDKLRLLLVGRRNAFTPATDLPENSRWQASSPQSTPNFSAACYFMGKALRTAQNVPIGLISASWGGSIIEDWLQESALRRAGDFDEPLAMLAAYDRSPDEGRAMWMRAALKWWADSEPGTRATVPWSSPRLDDSDWATTEPQGFWESLPGLTTFDGVVWYRVAVDLTAAQARGAARLSIGPVDDIDVTYVNGRQVGANQGWDTPRDYVVPAGTLHAGRNLIAVAALDTGGGGGAWGPAEQKRLTLADGSVVSLNTPWRYKVSAAMSDLPRAPPRQPWIGGSGTTTLSNGMIAPIAPYALRGAAWYQGESNTGDADGYARLLPGMIADWRDRFGDPALPFLIVQLADFGPALSRPVHSDWARLREVQRTVAAADPNVGLAVAIDIGDRYDIHPTNKQEVGRRLALEARRIAYHDARAERSPYPVSARREGDAVVVAFDGFGAGLTTYGSNDAVGFQLCGPDEACRYASGVVRGGEVVIPSDGQPVERVRFCWADSPICTLYGPNNLPATPFEMMVR